MKLKTVPCYLKKKENRDCWLKKPLESKVVSLGRNGFIRKEGMRYGEISKRFTNDEKTANLQDNNSGERPQRDNKDSVWKCNDFRYAPRDDYRREPRQAPRDLEKLQKPNETYNKRRYEESFASSKHREAKRKMKNKQIVAKRRDEGERVPEKSRAHLTAMAKEPHKAVSAPS